MMGARTASAQLGYVLGAAGGGLVIELLGFGALGFVLLAGMAASALLVLRVDDPVAARRRRLRAAIRSRCPTDRPRRPFDTRGLGEFKLQNPSTQGGGAMPYRFKTARRAVTFAVALAASAGAPRPRRPRRCRSPTGPSRAS